MKSNIVCLTRIPEPTHIHITMIQSLKVDPENVYFITITSFKQYYTGDYFLDSLYVKQIASSVKRMASLVSVLQCID